MWIGFVLLLQLIHFGYCLEIFEWQRDWGDGIFTRELAQILPEVEQIVHSATDLSATNNVPAITLSIYSYQSEEFPNGMMAIRPLLSEGHQMCFIGHILGTWSTDYSALRNRHGATISADEPEAYDLDLNVPGYIDPLSITSIADFCGVEQSHVFYLRQTASVSTGTTVLKIQGPFGGLAVMVGEDLEQTVLGQTTSQRHL